MIGQAGVKEKYIVRLVDFCCFGKWSDLCATRMFGVKFTFHRNKNYHMSSYSLAQAKDQLARLVDEALVGESVAILVNGQPLITLTPTEVVQPPLDDFLAKMRARTEARPSLGKDSVQLVREMRDEDPNRQTTPPSRSAKS